MTHPAPAPVTTGTLWASVDRLTAPRRTRVVRRPDGGKPTVEHHTVPSLLAQLQDAEGSTNSTDGGTSKSTGSRAPLDVAITALLHEMNRDTATALRGFGLTPRWLARTTDTAPTPRAAHVALYDTHTAPDGTTTHLPRLDPDTVAHLLEKTQRAIAATVERAALARAQRDTAADLRQLAVHLAGGRVDQDTVDRWTTTYRRWVTQAETALALLADPDAVTTATPRGSSCPTCLGTAVARHAEDGTTWEPPLLFTFRNGQHLHTTCRICGTGWWAGDGHHEVADHVAARRPTHTWTSHAPGQYGPTLPRRLAPPATTGTAPRGELTAERTRLARLLDIPTDRIA